MATQAYQAPTTFSQMQKQGVARPPSPAYGGATTNSGPQAQINPLTGVMPVSKTPAPGQPVGAPPVGNPLGGAYQGPGVTPIPNNEFYPLPSSSPGSPPPQQGPGTTPIPPGMNPGAPSQTPSWQPNQGNNWQQTGQDLYNQWKQGTPAQQFTPGANPFDAQLNQSVQNQLMNPSAYTSDMVKGTYDILNQQLGQDYDYQRKQLQNAMSKRGIDASTIHGNYYSDLGTEQARSQANLAYQLMTDQAKQYGTDMSTAINNAMGLNNQNYNQGLQGFYANQSSNQQAYDQNQQNLANYLNFGQQDFNNQLAVQQLNMQNQGAYDQLLQMLLGGVG